MNTATFQRNHAKAILVLGITLLLASCGGRPEKSVATNAPAPVIQASPTSVPATTPVVEPKLAPVVAPVEKVIVPEKKKVVTVTLAPEPKATVKTKQEPLPEPAPEPTLPPPVTGDFLGLDPDHVAGLLGQPQLVRREKPAEVWQYASAACVLHVFLYGDDAGNGLRVDHLEATDLQGAQASTDHCLKFLAGR